MRDSQLQSIEGLGYPLLWRHSAQCRHVTRRLVLAGLDFLKNLPEKSPDRRFLNGRMKKTNPSKSDILHPVLNNSNPRGGRDPHLSAVFSVDEAENLEIGYRAPKMTIERQQLMPLRAGAAGRSSGGSQKEMNAALNAYFQREGWTASRATRHEDLTPAASENITFGSFGQPDVDEAA